MSRLFNSQDFTAATASGRRLAFLDVLRGIAALSVCVHHVLERSAGYRNFSLQWFNLGTFGVVVFFLVSGFIIPASLEKHGTLLQFWRGRAFRLYPMYLVVLAAVFLLDALTHNPLCAETSHQALCVAANFTFLQEFFHVYSIISVAWTLSLEIVFYLLCSIAFAWDWRRAQHWLASTAALALLLCSVIATLVHRTFPVGRLGLLALSCYGVLLYAVYRGRESSSRLLAPGIFLFIALLVGFHSRAALHRIDRYGEGFTFTSLCTTWAAAAVCFGLFYLRRERAMPAPLHGLGLLGKISYSFYLLAWLALPLRPLLLPGEQWAWLDVLLPIAASVITYHVIERPFMRLASMRGSTRTLPVVTH